MRINKPQLFNGQYLASNDAILTKLFGAGNFTAGAEVFAPAENAKILSSLIDWSVIDTAFITGKVTGSDLKITSDTDAKTIKTYVDEAISGLTSGSIKTLTDNLSTVSGNLGTVSGNLDILEDNVANISLAKNTDAEAGYAATYTFTNATGATTKINIPKDQFLKNAEYVPSAEVLRFTFELSENGNDVDSVVNIPVGELVDEYSQGAGITITDSVDGKNVVSVNVKQGEKYLVATVDGLATTDALTEAIEAAGTAALNDAKGYTDGIISGLDVTDTAEAGKYVSAVSETDGKISVTRADLPTYTLTTGETAGTVKFNGEAVAVAGLGTAAYEPSTSFDPAGAAAGVKNELEPEIDYISGQVIGVAGRTVFAGDFSNDIAEANAGQLATAKAIKEYVDEKTEGIATDASLQQLQTKVDNVSAAVETAVTMATATINFGTTSSAIVSGRVIAVYDDEGVCYPTITYTGSEADKNVVATISADAANANYTVVYTKFVDVAE